MTRDVHVARFDDLSPRVLHDLLRLRGEVFVVEQACAYADLDGLDPAPGTEHVWVADGAGPAAYLRVLRDRAATARADAVRIGRVCTRRDARGAGLAGLLLRHTLDRLPGATAVLDAQAHLTGMYARLGFAACGPEYVEDGIPHVPMLRPPGQVTPAHGS